MRVRIIVVNAVDAVHVANEGVVDVDVPDVRPAAGIVIPGMVNLTKAQREPTYVKPDSEAKSAAAQEAHKRRSINRVNPDRTRRPAPASADVAPASIMKWRESPRRVVNPRIAPGADIAPVAIAV